jgi:anaerobic selenocysteine-containing dehydrogenase
MRTARFRSCPLCEAICGLELAYEDDRVVAIRGDAADPFSRGHVCPKGNAIIDLEHDPDRLRTPMRRVGDGWEPIGWDEALAWAGSRLAEIQKAHGAAAIAAYLGNPNVHHLGHFAYLPHLLRQLRTPNVFSASSVDQWPHQLVCAQMYGHQFLIPIPDVDRTDYFLMFGANPVESNGSLMTAPGIAKRLKALVARGRLVVVDPRRTETAAIASEHLFIRPGTDALFLVALLREVLALGPPRLERYGGRVAGLDAALAALAPFDLDAIAVRCGIDRATTARLARELHAAPTAVVYGRIGVSTQAFGSVAQWLIQLLNLVTGNLDREGGVLPNEPAIPITGPGTSPGKRDRWRSRVRGLPEFAGELPVAALAEEIATPGAGQVRALLTCAGNPVLSTPNGRALDAALAGLEFMVSIDVYINETTRHAHLVLPPASPLTQGHYDLVFNALAVRRVARWSAPVEPMRDGERADWQIVDGIGAAHAAAQGVAWTPLPPPEAIVADGLRRGGSGLDFATLAAAPHGIDLGPLRPSLMSRLQTPDGTIECAPPILLADLERLAASRREALGANTLQLIGRRELRSNNSWMHNAPRLVKGGARHQLWMHPRDLAARGIADGTRVRVRSAAGDIVVEAQANDDVMPGVACLPHGYGHDRAGVRLARAAGVPGASYNDVSDAALIDMPSGNAALSGIAVTVEPAVG